MNRLLFSSVISLFIPNMLIGQVENNVQLSKDSACYFSNNKVNIGYGFVDKNDVTGSVVVVDSDLSNKGFIISPQELIMGKVTGLLISSKNAMPGGDFNMNNRGANNLFLNHSPLIIVDDMIFNNNLSILNPNDIESFTILKDASASAIYGESAANGAIIITTKKGSKELKVYYTGKFGFSYLPQEVDVFSGDEYRTLINQRYAGNQQVISFLGEANTNWQNEIFQTGFGQDHYVSVSGSIKEIPFRVSLGKTDQNGILKTSEFSRTTTSVSVDPNLFDNHLKISVNLKGVFNNNSFANETAIGNAVKFDPTRPVYNPDETYYSIGNVHAPVNPVALLANTNDDEETTTYLGNFKIDYKLHFFPDLRLVFNYGQDNYTVKNNYLIDSTVSWIGGVKEDNNQTKKNTQTDFYLKYEKQFGESKIDIVAGYSYLKQSISQSDYKAILTTPAIILNNSSWSYEMYKTGIFGRLNYTLLNKYIFNATIRKNGESRHTLQYEQTYSPALSLAWKIKEESFLKGIDAISDFKIRMGWGTNKFLGDLGSGLYTPLLNTFSYDAYLKMASTTTFNVGVDFGLWKNKLTGTVDVYKRETIGFISLLPVADGSSFGNFIITNVGNMDIRGYEVSLTARPVTTPDFSWSISANLTYQKREITKLNRKYPGIETGSFIPFGGLGIQVQINTVGQAPNSFYTYQQVFDADGNPIEGVYVDRSGEGGDIARNVSNKYHYHNPDADYLIGINSRLNYRNLDFSFSGRLSLGNYVYNNGATQTFQSLYENNMFFNNMPSSAVNIGFEGSGEPWSEIYVQNASFFKMDNISVGYSFEKFVKETNARIGFTVQNAFIITNYEGLDPEVVGGIDTYTYPRPRIFSLELNVGF